MSEQKPRTPKERAEVEAIIESFKWLPEPLRSHAVFKAIYEYDLKKLPDLDESGTKT